MLACVLLYNYGTLLLYRCRFCSIIILRFLLSLIAVVCVVVGIQYSPSLPVIKRHVWQRMPGGNITKVIVTYKKVNELGVLLVLLYH